MMGHAMAAIGAMLFVLGSGCAAQPDLSVASAMVRTDDVRAQASGLRVTIALTEIVTP